MSKTTSSHGQRRACLKRAASVALVASAALAASGAQASAARDCNGNMVKWNDWSTLMYISTTSFPEGSAWDTALQNALWHWNNVGGSGFTYGLGRDTDGSHGENGVNEVYMSSSEAGSALAVTHVYYHCYWAFGWSYGLDETDMAFNSNLSWDTGKFVYANGISPPYNFELVALHELGHALGLTHEDGVQATMNTQYPAGGPLGYFKQVNPLADDRVGLRNLYPNGGTQVDLAASAFKRTGSGTSGLVNSPLSAARGSNVTYEFTFSNLGTSTASFYVNFYLSSNDYITTADRMLGWGSYWANPGGTGTFSVTLFIPADVAPGTYFLGVLLDPSNYFSESFETNNPQPMPRSITIF
jgi:hypothetical protein